MHQASLITKLVYAYFPTLISRELYLVWSTKLSKVSLKIYMWYRIQELSYLQKSLRTSTIRLFLHRFSIPQINTILINTQMSASSHKLVHLMLNIEYQILETRKMSSQYSIFHEVQKSEIPKLDFFWIKAIVGTFLKKNHK